MAEWVYEDGIGERRAALVDEGRIVVAQIERDSDGLRAGAVVDAQLTDQRLRLARAESGEELYLSRLPAVSEGSAFRAMVQRMAIPERDLIKRAVGVPTDAATPLTGGPSLTEGIAASGLPMRASVFGEDSLADAGWHEVIDEAASGIVNFPGGLLRIHLTPAMTVFDVDGEAAGLALANSAVVAVAAAIRRHGISGNVVIDLPSLPDVAARKAVAIEFDQAMAASETAFERTAINGFGLLQIILPRPRASLLERVQLAQVDTAALALLRRAERAVGVGPLTLAAHPAEIGWLKARPALLTELMRRTGRQVGLHADPASAMGAGHAQ